MDVGPYGSYLTVISEGECGKCFPFGNLCNNNIV